MAQACDPQSLVSAAKCVEYCLTPGMQMPALIYLACQAAGQATNPASLQQLAANARCVETCIAPGMMWPVLVNLACVIAGGSGGGPMPPTPPASCSDADASKFLSAAGISDTTTVNAVCTLVTSFKAAGVWTLMDGIYPMVGGTSTSCAWNLKQQQVYNITWHNGPLFSAAGVIGDGVSTYGDTGFNPNTTNAFGIPINYSLNSAALGFDCATVLGSPGTSPMGANVGGGAASEFNGGANVSILGPNSFFSTNAGSNAAGIYVGSRTGASTGSVYWPGGNAALAGSSVSIPTVPLFLLAEDTGVASQFFAGTISFAFISAGMTPTQVASVQAAITTFQTSLGRT